MGGDAVWKNTRKKPWAQAEIAAAGRSRISCQ